MKNGSGLHHYEGNKNRKIHGDLKNNDNVAVIRIHD